MMQSGWTELAILAVRALGVAATPIVSWHVLDGISNSCNLWGARIFFLRAGTDANLAGESQDVGILNDCVTLNAEAGSAQYNGFQCLIFTAVDCGGLEHVLDADTTFDLLDPPFVSVFCPAIL
ncbi:hypothetical protein C8J56DRAFT_1117556 [Mycena floridula]|nr:hypothetical protein C8J56DRAFT_1117556 [Mycena floridula]